MDREFLSLTEDLFTVELGNGISNHKRHGKWTGTIGSGGSFIKDLRISNVAKNYNIPYSIPGYSGAGLVYDVEINLLNPIEWNDDSRLETFSTWHHSGNEFYYIAQSLDIKMKQQPQIFKEISDIISSQKEDIIEAFQKGYDYAAQHVPSNDQFAHFITKVKDSAVPTLICQDVKKKWRDYYELKDNRVIVSLDGLRIKQKIDKFNKLMSDGNFEDLIKTKHIINGKRLTNALRARKGSYKILKKSNKHIFLSCIKNRDRTADAAGYLSYEGYGNKDNPEYKKAAKKDIYRIIKDLGKVENFSETGALSYVKISKMEDKTYLDLANGEAQCALFLDFLPYVYSISGIVPSIKSKMCSGINATPEMNGLVSAAYCKYLKEEHGITDALIGSDNVVLPISESEWTEIVKAQGTEGNLLGGLDLAERFLGFRDRRHYPVQLVRDSPSHNSGWNNYYNGFLGQRSAISIDRVFGTIIMYDYWKTDSAVKLYEWVSEDEHMNDSFKENYGYAKGWLLDQLHNDKEKVKIYDKFKEEYEVTKTKLELSTSEDFDDWKWNI